MGVDFILKKREKFKHRRDRMFAENIQSANLLSAAPEKTVHQFRCRAEGDLPPETGMGVLLFQEESKIQVAYLNKKIGFVMSPDAASLANHWRKAGLELSSATIVEVRPGGNIFLIQLL